MIRLITFFIVVLFLACALPGWAQSTNSIQLRNASGSTIIKAAATGGPFTLTFPSTLGGNGQTLISDGAGALSWGNAGATSIDGLSDAFSNSNVVALGSDAGKDIVGGGGGYSVLIGNNAGKALVSSTNNVAVGYNALLIATGANNVSIGTESLNGLTAGTNNVAIGNYAGSGASLTTGTGNVFIGDNVRPSTNVSNKLYIDNSYSATDQPLIYGDFSANTLTFNGSVTTTGTGVYNKASNDEGGEINLQYSNSGSESSYWVIDEHSPAASEARLRIYAGATETNGFCIEGDDGHVGIGITDPTEKLHVSGNIRATGSVYAGQVKRNYRADVTGGTHAVQDTDSWIIVNRSSGATTITLPDPTLAANLYRELMIKTVEPQAVVSASTNVWPLNGGAATTAILPAFDGAWATLVCDGTNWVIMQSGQ